MAPEQGVAGDGPHGDAWGAEVVPSSGPRFCGVDVADVALDLLERYARLVFQETDPPRRTLVCQIGVPEAAAIAAARAGVAAPRPTSHQLAAAILGRMDVEVIAVRLVGRAGRAYLAEIDLARGGRLQTFDCRPTDAVLLCLHHDGSVPIVVDERLLSGDGDVLPDSGSGTGSSPVEPVVHP
jgi:bifunctional DNase/RNase